MATSRRPARSTKGKGKAKAEETETPAEEEEVDEGEKEQEEEAEAPKAPSRRPARSTKGKGKAKAALIETSADDEEDQQMGEAGKEEEVPEEQQDDDEDDEDDDGGDGEFEAGKKNRRSSRARRGPVKRTRDGNDDSDDDSDEGGGEGGGKSSKGGNKAKRSRKGSRSGGGGGGHTSSIFLGDDDDDGDADGEGAGGGSASSSQWADAGFTQGEEERWVNSQKVSTQVLEKDKKKGDELSEELKKELINETCRYILFKGTRHEPIKRNDLRNEVFKKQGKQANGVLNFILSEAEVKLNKTFGFSLVSGQESKKWFQKDTWYLKNQLKNDSHMKKVNEGYGASSRGLLMLILTMIECQGGEKKIREDKMINMLKEHVDSRIPVYGEDMQGNRKRRGPGAPATLLAYDIEGLGNMQNAIANFVKQHYLIKTPVEVQGDDENMNAYSWGARTHIEVGRRQMVYFIAQSLGQTPDVTALNQISDDEEEESDEEEEEEEAAE